MPWGYVAARPNSGFQTNGAIQGLMKAITTEPTTAVGGTIVVVTLAAVVVAGEITTLFFAARIKVEECHYFDMVLPIVPASAYSSNSSSPDR